MTAQREPGSRKKRAGTIEMSDVRPDFTSFRSDRLLCQMLEVETKPSRVTLQCGNGGYTGNPQEIDRL